jgi:hypothetical protein
MNCLPSLGCWDRGFKSHSGHGCLVCVCVYSVCVVLCLGRGLATIWSLVRGVLPSVKVIMKLKEEARAHGGCRGSEKQNHICTEVWTPCANREWVCALENFQWCGELCFAGAAISIDFFFFLIAPTRGSLLPLWSIGLSFLSFLIKDSR